jgi:glycerol-3-phosphate dehydrogenase (NAD(P)+)
MRVAVVGAGSWGTTVAGLTCHNADTTLWARRKELADELNEEHTNSGYLPDIRLPQEMRATSSLEEAVGSADVVVMAVPSHGFRDVLTEVADHVRPWVPVLSLTKGLEQGSNKRMTEVINELLPDHPAGVLTGPNLAREVAVGHPAAAVVAMADRRIARALRPVFAGPTFLVFTNLDIIGCELAAVVKNVLAIAAGMVDGMGFGDNTKATLLTRGLTEMTRLGVTLGGQPLTFSGLAGMGDLVATCSSPLSRNRTFGEKLGRGMSVEEVQQSTRQTAEGVKSCRSVLDLARAHDVYMPLTEAVVRVCHEGEAPARMVKEIMTREAKPE